MWAVSAAVPKLPEGVTKTELSFLLKRFLIGLIFGLPVGAVGTLVVQRSFRQGFWQGLLQRQSFRHRAGNDCGY